MITSILIFKQINLTQSSNTNLYNSIYYKSKLNGSKYCYISLTIQLNISHLFTQSIACHFFFRSLNVKEFYLTHR